jgi:hypothetical protein
MHLQNVRDVRARIDNVLDQSAASVAATYSVLHQLRRTLRLQRDEMDRLSSARMERRCCVERLR